MIGKVLISDARTKLVLHTEVLHRSETENISTRMEVEGLKRLMSHYYDGWHLVKWLGNELRKVSKVRNCEGVWTEKVKTHLWAAIHSGVESGADIRALFNTCLMHVAGVHQWPLNELTGRFTSCPHDSLPGPRLQDLSADSEAYQNFRDVILTKSFQRDLMKASTYGGTSICEAKNALDRIYCRKEIFYPIATYPLYAMMATLHINTLRLAEISGERKVLKTREVQRKYLDRKSKQVLKSPAKHLGRDLVLDGVLNGRLIALQAKYQSGVPQWVVDLMDAEDEYECSCDSVSS
ncbi:hypothetical protein GCK32_017319 [Trichostrongylus colubriformis]|uniref:Transposase n=1 Tax=Trichostrongylus colubriformis TaxID=6319 RepID=A0AAN8FKX4_TRICO